jgi:prolyl 4-hydroxylase
MSDTRTAAAQPVTPELRRWIVAQAEAGCTPDAVLQAMRQSGWSEDVAIAAMEETLTARLHELGRPLPDEQALAEQAALAAQPGRAPSLPGPVLQGQPTTLHVQGQRVDVVCALQRPRVVVFGHLLSDAECDELIALAKTRLVRSETVDNSTGGSEVNAARTSDGMFFLRGEAPVIARIEERIAALLNWPLENGEGLQVLRYRPGAEYKPHHDYFDPAQPGAPSILARGGQRVGTLVMYLNTPEGGGATTFPEVGLEVGPVRGSAVFFSYDRPDPSTQTLHGGAPVLAGEKWVATKWLRQGRFD